MLRGETVEDKDYLYNGSIVRVEWVEVEFGLEYAKVFFLDWVEEERENKTEIILTENLIEIKSKQIK